jgi:gamma-glutamylcyclotransferase (GGCT)/AIG2-like uncharacterized protein YtfP
VSNQTVHLFVYGTLRPPRAGARADDSRLYPAIAPYVLEAVPARLPGATLYDLGAYPGARPGEGTLYGDLLYVRPPALDLADRCEGHPDFFHRQEVMVQTSTGLVQTWIYWAPARLVDGQPRIAGGNWFDRSIGQRAIT